MIELQSKGNSPPRDCAAAGSEESILVVRLLDAGPAELCNCVILTPWVAAYTEVRRM